MNKPLLFLSRRVEGGEIEIFLTTKWFRQRSYIIFIIFPAQVVDPHSWPSSEVNFAVAHRMEFKVQSHVGSSVLLFPSLPPAAPLLLSVMPRSKARHAFQHNLSFFVLETIFKFIYQLRDNCFTEFCCFLSNINMNRASLVAQLVKNPPAMQETWVWSLGWEIPWRRERLPTLVFWPGESHGLYSPWGGKELDTTERLPLSTWISHRSTLSPP